jgi:hypothetical protein
MSRTLGPLAALAMVALIGVGCSNAPAENGNAGNTNAGRRSTSRTSIGACGGPHSTTRSPCGVALPIPRPATHVRLMARRRRRRRRRRRQARPGRRRPRQPADHTSALLAPAGLADQRSGGSLRPGASSLAWEGLAKLGPNRQDASGVASKTVPLNLTADEALVLYEFLTRYTDSDQLETVDQAEQRALWNLCALLERALAQPFDPSYADLLASARGRLRDSA